MSGKIIELHDNQTYVWVIEEGGRRGHVCVQGRARLVKRLGDNICLVDFGDGEVMRHVDPNAQENPFAYVAQLNR